MYNDAKVQYCFWGDIWNLMKWWANTIYFPDCICFFKFASHQNPLLKWNILEFRARIVSLDGLSTFFNCNNISWQGKRNLSSSLRNSAAAAVHGSLFFFFPTFWYFFFQKCSVRDILLPKLFWLTVRKNWNSRLKAENLQKFAKICKILRSLEQFIQTVKGENNFW